MLVHRSELVIFVIVLGMVKTSKMPTLEDFERETEHYEKNLRFAFDGPMKTFLSPMERMIKFLTSPLIPVKEENGTSTTSKPETQSNRGKLGKVIGAVVGTANTIVKPVKDFIIRPVEKIVVGGFSQVLNGVGEKIKGIYPGTEWCGAGDIAGSVEEVGVFFKTDGCCREHDLCSSNIDAGDTKFGLENNGIFTRSNCECDVKFFNCLKNAKTLVATNIGITYFNLLRPQCFKLEYPAYCTKFTNRRVRNNKCLEYVTDASAGNKTYQWFDSPDF